MSIENLFLSEVKKPTYTLHNHSYYEKLLKDNLAYLTSLSVRDALLYKKYIELRTVGIDSAHVRNIIFQMKNNLWQFNEPDDYMKIKPQLIACNSRALLEKWEIFKNFISIASVKTNPGRAIKFIVIDEPTKKYLGCISIGSDFLNIGGRDEVIGWKTSEDKFEKLKHTMMASTLVPTQPLGSNYLGGKLITLLCNSDVVEEYHNSAYKEPLLGITTTSLFGGYSQYNNLSYWKKCKSTEGKVHIEPSDDVYKEILNWIYKTYPDIKKSIKEKCKKPGASVPSSHPKTITLDIIYKMFKVKPVVSNYTRGVYWCALKERTNEYLSGRSTDWGNKKFDNSVEALTKLWQEKYASKRIKKLREQDRISHEHLWLDDMLTMSKEEMFAKYSREED